MNTSPEKSTGKVIDLAEKKAQKQNEAEKVAADKLTSLSLKAKETETVQSIDAKLKGMSPEEWAEFMDMIRKEVNPGQFEAFFKKIRLFSPIGAYEVFKTIRAEVYQGMLLTGMIGTREQQEQFASTLNPTQSEAMAIKALGYANQFLVKDPETKALISAILMANKIQGESMKVLAEVRKRVEIQSEGGAEIIDLAEKIESDANSARLPCPPENLDPKRIQSQG